MDPHHLLGLRVKEHKKRVRVRVRVKDHTFRTVIIGPEGEGEGEGFDFPQYGRYEATTLHTISHGHTKMILSLRCPIYIR